MSVYDDAVRDVKELKESAMESAKNTLLEAMVPKVKEMVEQQLGETDIALEMDAVDEVSQFDETTQVDEEVETEEVELEAKKKDDDEDDEVVDEAAQVDEVVEVNESDLVEALADALKEVRTRMTSEAKVSKSFGEPKSLKTSGGSGDKGLADEKSGEHYWSGEKPPAAKDWTVREQVMRKQIVGLVEQVKQYKGAYGKLLQNLKEVNLFNAKLIYTNKVLQTPGLSNKSRLAIVEQFDNARSKNDVELVYNTFTESFKIAGVMGESAKKLQRGSRASPPSSTVLKEQMKRETQEEQRSGEDREETLLESWERLSGVSDILKD